jgi:putative flippase GtrA
MDVKAELVRFLRANLSSIIATTVTWALVVVLTTVRLHYLVAATVGAIAGAATDFTIKRHWAFDRDAKGHVAHEALRYVLVAIGSLAWNLFAAYLFVDRLGLPPTPGVIVASITVGVAWNNPLHRYVVFR